jgi:integrase
VGSGLRSTELCQIDVRDVDFAHRHINVEDAKTEAGVRKVDLTPMLLDDLLAWRTSLTDSAADSPFFPTRRGNRRTKDNINARVLSPAVRRANERRAQRGPAAAAEAGHRPQSAADLHLDDVRCRCRDPYVMAQVGHDDSKVTLEIYAQVLKRRDRDDIGIAFDHLLLGRDETQGTAAEPTAKTTRSSEPETSRVGRDLGLTGDESR